MVTGARGLLGAHLCRLLFKSGREVHAVTRWLPRVEDAVEGLTAAARARSAEGSAIDFVSGVLVLVKSVIELLVQLVNLQIKPMFGVIADRPLEQVHVSETDRSFAMTRWKPITSLEDGLKQTVDWYARQSKEG